MKKLALTLVALMIASMLAVAGCSGEATATPTKSAAAATAAPTVKAATTTTAVTPTVKATTVATTTTSVTPTVKATTVATTTAATTPAAQTGSALSVSGLVDKPMKWTLAELKALKVEKITAEHPKKGKQEYSGVRLSVILGLVAPKADAKTLVFTASDGYKAEAPLATVKSCTDCMIAIGDANDLSTVMPGMDGQNWVKNVSTIEVK